MRTRLLALLVLVTSCHKLLDLEYIERRDAGAGMDTSDGRTSDAPDAWIRMDAAMCPPALGPDEDGDSIDDSCDACPTVASDLLDNDGDALPNACDYELAAGDDAVVFAATFASASELGVNFTSAAASHTTANLGMVAIGPGGEILTKASVTPLAIEVRFSGFEPDATASAQYVQIGTDDVKCSVTAGSCNGIDSAQSCVRLSGTSAASSLAASAQGLTRVYMEQKQNVITCTAYSGGTSAAVGASVPLDHSAIVVRAIDASTDVKSVVVYGAR